jgi:mono/diheme cytochrome c family protein
MVFGMMVTMGIAVTAGQQPAVVATAAGTYTPKQAEAGKVAYTQNCEGCHRADFQGEQDAKPLAGMTFLNSWRGKTSDDLVGYISRAMPPDTPGVAGDEGNLNIVAYLLQANKVPSGVVPLDYESAVPIPAPSDKK